MTKDILQEIQTISIERLEGLIAFWLSLPNHDEREEALTLWMIHEKQKRLELCN